MKLSKVVAVALPVLPGVYSVVINDKIGDVQILYQNDLLANSTSTSALLVHRKKCYSDAITACSALSESLLTDVTPDLEDQLNYLVFSGQVVPYTKLFVAQGSGSCCSAYDTTQKAVVKVDCATELPALCTNSAPPYNITQLGASVSQQRQVTSSGSNYNITGYRDARSFRFIGIPFALPPVGPLRFAPPVLYNTTKQITAFQPGKACIQLTTPYGVKYENQTSEDCLYLNVYTPYIPSADAPCDCSAKKPVMVYFYGGSFEEGWANVQDYDGGNLVSRGDVVVVTLNYRVGILGSVTTANELDGNQGIKDQILALKWVQQNIASFGGDSSRVTIFGQSAGGQSVVAQLSSSASKGLFSAAISQSAPLGISWVTRSVNSKYITPALSNVTNCTSTIESELVACLRAVPASDFVSKPVVGYMLEAATKAYGLFDQRNSGLSEAEPYLPITAASGGTEGVIDDQFRYLLANNTLPNRVAFMAGTTKNEGGLFINGIPGFGKQLPNTEKEYIGVLESGQIAANDTIAGIIKDGTFPLNMSNPDGIRYEISDFITAYAYQCPNNQDIKIAADNHIFPKLYQYVFDKGVPQAVDSYPECFPLAENGQQTCHTSDIAEVWGRTDIFGYAYNSTNSLPFTKYVMDVWTSFARTHNPQPTKQYLEARGAGYESTLQITSKVPFPGYASQSSGVVHHFDLPPSNSGPVRQAQCETFAKSGGLGTDRINNGL